MDFLLNAAMDSQDMCLVLQVDMDLLNYMANCTLKHLSNDALLEKAADLLKIIADQIPEQIMK